MPPPSKPRQDPLATELVGAEVGNLDDNDVEDQQSTADDSTERLLGLDNRSRMRSECAARDAAAKERLYH